MVFHKYLNCIHVFNLSYRHAAVVMGCAFIDISDFIVVFPVYVQMEATFEN